MIVPVPPQGMGDFAWVNDNSWRNWLTNDEALELKGLIASYNFDAMPFRVKRAMRHFDYACLTHYPDVRLTLVVTGLEALVNNRKGKEGRRFRKRIALLSKDAGMDVSEDVAGQAYEYRSSLVHGQGMLPQEIDNQFIEVYGIVETLLRRIVRKCVEDPSFSSHFEGVEAIEKMYPL
jgi:hypothetical protein